MQITHPHTLLTLAWLAIGQLCTGCSAEDIAVEQSNTGVLCLQMSSDEDFVQVETRAVQTLTDWSGYTFKLDDKPISFTDGKAIIPAGTYTLSATNANAKAVEGGYGGPLYSGSSDEFTVTAGEQKAVTLTLGKPKNAKVTIELSKEFNVNGLYTFVSLTLTDGTGSNTITPDEPVAYFPATNTTLSYTLVANANINSHVQDITGASGTVTIAPGTHTKLTLDVNPIDGYIRIDGGGEYGEEFE